VSKKNDEYKNSRRFAVALYAVVIAFDVWVFATLGKDGVTVLMTTLPMLLVHAMAYMHITNKENTSE